MMTVIPIWIDQQAEVPELRANPITVILAAS